MNQPNLPYVNVAQLKALYAPYNRFDGFEQGFRDYLAGNCRQEFEGVFGQAYDRGLECGMKAMQAARRIAATIGAN